MAEDAGRRRGSRERRRGRNGDRGKRRSGRSRRCKDGLNQTILDSRKVANVCDRGLNIRNGDLYVKAEPEDPTQLESPGFVKGLLVRLRGELAKEVLYYRNCLVMMTGARVDSYECSRYG